ncbi:MAG: hypothetical protein RLN60_02200 [Phycisphaerales bacterium]
MMREPDILRALRAGEVELPPLAIQLVGIEPQSEANGRVARPDAYVDIGWRDRTYRFVAEIKVQATPKTFRDAIEQVRAYSEASEMRPLLVTTYLAPERLKELESKGVSGVDLNGNGVVVIPGELLVVRTGNPNQYPAGRSIRNIYQGASSLVARVFLSRPRFESVQEVLDEVTRRGGRVALSTVSKVLKVLEEDLVIRREGRTSELLQADELLDRLADGYRPPRISARKKYRWVDSSSNPLESLRDWNRRLVLTGAASVDQYAVMPREKTVQCYCTAIEPIEQELSGRLEESPRFPDLELVETRDPTVYFDNRSMDTVSAASPLQSWLELRAGDKRQSDAAETVRTRILEELRRSGWSSP